jgi:hypothetical protein
MESFAMESSNTFDALRAFRRSFYECFDRRADALLELSDAILAAGAALSPVHLSLEAVHGSARRVLQPNGKISAPPAVGLLASSQSSGEPPER